MTLPVPVDPATQEAIRAAIIKTVCDTFHEMESWGVEPAGEDWQDLINQVNGDLSWCCPVCQEVACDEDCPLAPVRTEVSS